MMKLLVLITLYLLFNVHGASFNGAKIGKTFHNYARVNGAKLVLINQKGLLTSEKIPMLVSMVLLLAQLNRKKQALIQPDLTVEEI